MMRKNSTSRLVHTLSPDSTRPCEIAATDMALSRGVWSRDGASDMGVAVKPIHARFIGPLRQQNHLCRAGTGVVTKSRGGVRLGMVKSSLRSRNGGNMAIKFGRPIEMRDA